MAFHDVRLPPDVEQGAKGGPNFQTATISLSGGVEQRIVTWEQARAAWDVGYGCQTPEDFLPVEAFFYARRGKANSFRFRDTKDYTCALEPLGTGTGTLRTFLFVKTYEPLGPAPYVRRITRPVVGTVNIYVNGLLADPGTYDVAYAGGWVRFHPGSAPANGLVVKYDCQFDIPSRFDVDNLELTLYWLQAGEIPHLPVVEVRDVVNQSPTISLANTVTTLPESTSTASHVRVADVVVNDDPFGEDVLTLSGADAAFFELVGTLTSDGDGVSLYLKAGTVLDTSVKTTYAVTVNVTDTSLSPAVASSVGFTETISSVEGPPHVALTNLNASLVWNQSTASRVRVADVVVTQHNAGATNNILSLTGADASVYELFATSSGHNFTTGLYIKAGTAGAPNSSSTVHYDVTVNVSNADFSSPPQDSKNFTTTFGVAGSTTVDTSPGDHVYVVPEYQTLVIEGWGGGAGGPGGNSVGGDGRDTTLASKGLTAHGGKAPLLTVASGPTGTATYNTQGGDGGTATGGDTNTTGAPGGNGFAKRVITGGSVTSGPGGASPSGGAGGASVSASAPAQPYVSNPCSSTPPSPYPVPGTVTGVNGLPGGAPGAGGSGCAIADWEVVLSLSNGYCWTLYGQGRPGGGAGGYFSKTYIRSVTPGAPVPGDSLSYHVGDKGIGGPDTTSGGDGANGKMKFTVS